MSGLRDILTQDSFFLVFLLEAEMFQSRYSGAPVGRMLWIGNRHLLNGRMEESFQLQSFDIDRRTPWHPNDNPAECIHKQRARHGKTSLVESAGIIDIRRKEQIKRRAVRYLRIE